MTAIELKNRRLAAGLTMAQLAIQAGLAEPGDKNARQRINTYESGRTAIPKAVARLFLLLLPNHSDANPQEAQAA